MTLQQLFMALDIYAEKIPISFLVENLTDLKLSMDEVQQHAEFSDKTYRRNLLYRGDFYQALVLCWKNGQRSPIHNHKGSSCGVKVLEGVAIESIFDIAPNGLIYPTSSRTLNTGEVIGSSDADVHQISNLQSDDRNLVTLHIYSPPLLHMDCYSLERNEVESFDDPVYDHGYGI